MKQIPENIFPVCSSLLGADAELPCAYDRPGDLDELTAAISRFAAAGGFPAHIADLAAVEAALYRVRETRPPAAHARALAVNPTLHVVPCRYRGILALALGGGAAAGRAAPPRGDEIVLAWRHPRTGELRNGVASPDDLLALKVVVEGLRRNEVAVEGGRPVGVVDEAIGRAVRRGILVGPPSLIRRDPAVFLDSAIKDEEFLVSTVFTIQWHVTQACDLHCKHCYDRSARAAVSLEQGLGILDDLRDFCIERNVWGQVSFSGGNPLLHPDFLELYRAAVDRGFAVAILGNPAPAESIDELIAIQHPVFYQVSLEGFREHNDVIRGDGHFDRTMAFLEILKERAVFSMVMLTLTGDNIGDVIPLGRFLKGKTDLFTFNRLAMVGEGAKLKGPPLGRFPRFLDDYMTAAETNPAMRLKDNLINIVRHRKGLPPFGGCAGHGCGAAFNFVSILPDGEVHACRKLPSPIGNVHERSLGEIYDSTAAKRYREGPAACRSCPIRPVCGGCLAVVYGLGLNVFEDRDPYCFMLPGGSSAERLSREDQSRT